MLGMDTAAVMVEGKPIQDFRMLIFDPKRDTGNKTDDFKMMNKIFLSIFVIFKLKLFCFCRFSVQIHNSSTVAISYTMHRPFVSTCQLFTRWTLLPLSTHQTVTHFFSENYMCCNSNKACLCEFKPIC